ncbi:Chaperone protein ClpD2, chloroplastic [Zea mays]|uniref:Chaperone protein ClpD2, chloroplastic n=2 Tax=Zea mays TaxID=4577 RepID=A0A3L6FDA5_MAIZE|nr:Chaperone protein ClpD2, chloroplastic [Zea mays]
MHAMGYLLIQLLLQVLLHPDQYWEAALDVTIFCKKSFLVIAQEGINAAVYLSARYIPDRHLPDKAIDLIDEAGSRARMESFKKKKEEQCSILSKSPDEYWQEIRAVQSTHEVALVNRLKYSLDENDKEDGVNIEVIGDNKIASPSMPPTSVDE